MREHGIKIIGPDPETLIDPIAPDELRGAVRSLLTTWGTEILEQPEYIQHRGYQSYTVLSLCRSLYTLQSGSVVSKRVAAQWGQQTLAAHWVSPIARAW